MRHPVRSVFLLGGCCLVQACSSPPVILVASPATATIYRENTQDRVLTPIGVGQAQLKFSGDATSVRIVVSQDGFLDYQKTFTKGSVTGQYRIFLDRRIVDISSLPFDAQLFVNGKASGQGRLKVEVPEGGTTTVELKKPGFATVRRVYEWPKESTKYPPSTDRLELSDRQVTVALSPNGAELFSGETRIGQDLADVTIPPGTCAKVRAQKEGWAPVERQYCNREGAAAAPLNDDIALTARIVTVTGPANAQIVVNNRSVGVGSAQVRVPEEGCVVVRVDEPGFLSAMREYCGSNGVSTSVMVPVLDRVELQSDKAWEASDPSVQANVNITVEVGEKLAEERAWKIMSSVVLSHFDVLENSDRETGYLRTAWSSKTFDGQRVIRTRIVVKRQSDSPLRYGVKIMSEELGKSAKPGQPLDASEDQNYVAWPRLLKTYQDVISEMQARLK